MFCPCMQLYVEYKQFTSRSASLWSYNFMRAVESCHIMNNYIFIDVFLVFSRTSIKKKYFIMKHVINRHRSTS